MALAAEPSPGAHSPHSALCTWCIVMALSAPPALQKWTSCSAFERFTFSCLPACRPACLPACPPRCRRMVGWGWGPSRSGRPHSGWADCSHAFAVPDRQRGTVPDCAGTRVAEANERTIGIGGSLGIDGCMGSIKCTWPPHPKNGAHDNAEGRSCACQV